MKTKSTSLFLSSILLFAALGFSIAPDTFAQAARSSPAATIKAFYNWHIRSTNGGSTPKEENAKRKTLWREST